MGWGGADGRGTWRRSTARIARKLGAGWCARRLAACCRGLQHLLLHVEGVIHGVGLESAVPHGNPAEGSGLVYPPGGDGEPTLHEDGEGAETRRETSRAGGAAKTSAQRP